MSLFSLQAEISEIRIIYREWISKTESNTFALFDHFKNCSYYTKSNDILSNGQFTILSRHFHDTIRFGRRIETDMPQRIHSDIRILKIYTTTHIIISKKWRDGVSPKLGTRDARA